MIEMGMTRPVDHLGRIVIPKELRSSFGIMEKDRMAFFVKDDFIILGKIANRCALCGTKDENELHKYGRNVLCKSCISDIQGMGAGQ